jgi:hypothetical protein
MRSPRGHSFLSHGGCARRAGIHFFRTADALAARAFISFARPKETNQRKAAGSISEAKNRTLFPKTGKRSPLRSVWTSPFLHGKNARFSSRLSEEAGSLFRWPIPVTLFRYPIPLTYSVNLFR